MRPVEEIDQVMDLTAPLIENNSDGPDRIVVALVLRACEASLRVEVGRGRDPERSGRLFGRHVQLLDRQHH